MRRVGRPPLGTAARQLIAIRIDPQVLVALQREAKRRGLGYQSLINQLPRSMSHEGAAPDLQRALRLRVLHEPAEGIHELHLLDGLASGFEKARRTDQDSQALGAGNGHVKAIAGE
jgi:hypothetical protein